jgi:decaprenylphospho-beta-D-erythro-pentofuranosid-2-ulose 2-reductase
VTVTTPATNDTWLILGASSATARAFAHQAAQSGADLLLVGRDQADIQLSAQDCQIRYGIQARALALDITDFGQHAAFIQDCQKLTQGRVHLYVCVGTLPDQAAVQAAPSQMQAVFDVNLSGIAALLLQAMPLLEQQTGSKVLVFGSVAGDRGRLSNFVYGAAKAGLHTFVSGYRALCFKKGIQVTLIKPGFMDTAMTYGLPGMFLVASPQDCAKACWQALEKGKDTFYFPGFWGLIMLVIRMIPGFIFKKLPL